MQDKEYFYSHALVDEFLQQQAPNCQLPTAQASGTLGGGDSSINHLALLLLGFGRVHAVLWAQQWLGVDPDGVAIQYAGLQLLYELAQEPSSKFAGATLLTQLAIAHWKEGIPWQVAKAEKHFR